MIPEKTTTTAKENAIATAMKDYVAYNLWANTTLVNWLRSKPAALMEQEVPSSFPTIKGTLVHIWQTQQYWFSVISNTEFIRVAFTGNVEDIFRLLPEQSGQMAEYICSMTAEDLQADTPVVNKWFECNFPNFDYLIQCMNHSTYHRGQVVTIGRNVGLTDAPMTDYNYYKVFGRQA